MNEANKLTQKDVEEILRLVQSADHIVDFHIKYGDLELSLSRSEAGSARQAEAAPHAAAPAAKPDAAPPPTAPKDAEPAAAASPAPAASAGDEGLVAVKAPMVGTFYRAPSPGATPFVEVGARVTPETVVGIIEVMKLMNSLPAGVSGTVRQILVKDSQPVGFGERLILIEPDA